jgi:hypothetical protein
MNLKVIIQAVGCVSDGCMNCVPGELCPSFSSSGPHEPKYICGPHELFIDKTGDVFLLAVQNFVVIKNNSQQ